MSGFPNLKPAFTARLKSDTPFSIGNTSNGDIVQVVPIIWGTIRNEPDYPVVLNAEVKYGSDEVRVEASQGHVRINVSAVLQNSDGSHLLYKYGGSIEIDPGFMAIFTGSPDARSTDFGKAFTQVKFEASDEHLRVLNYGVFVGSAHFIIEKNGDLIIETKISQVVG